MPQWYILDPFTNNSQPLAVLSISLILSSPSPCLPNPSSHSSSSFWLSVTAWRAETYSETTPPLSWLPIGYPHLPGRPSALPGLVIIPHSKLSEAGLCLPSDGQTSWVPAGQWLSQWQSPCVCISDSIVSGIRSILKTFIMNEQGNEAPNKMTGRGDDLGQAFTVPVSVEDEWSL